MLTAHAVHGVNGKSQIKLHKAASGANNALIVIVASQQNGPYPARMQSTYMLAQVVAASST